MHCKAKKFFITWLFCCLAPFYGYSFQASLPQTDTNDSAQALATLTYHAVSWEKQLKRQNTEVQDTEEEIEDIVFSKEEVMHLWDRVAHEIYILSDERAIQSQVQFEKAYALYQKAQTQVDDQESKKAQRTLVQVSKILDKLWEKAIEPESQESLISSLSLDVLMRSKTLALEPDYSHLPDGAMRKMRPYILPDSHPMKERLNVIFFASRVTANEQAFNAAGFHTICERPRTFVRVASHPLLPGYLIKVYLDTEMRKKQGLSSWEWLVKRCEGADKVRHIIKKRNFKYFVVPNKWIYPFPKNPAPPHDSKHTRHLALLLVTDMNLAPDDLNHYAWKNYITEEHLHELYDIMTYAKGSSYRPDNISYTNLGQFAFIDTEYPSRGPDYSSIRRHLNHKMRSHWDRLIKQGKK